MNRRKVIHKRRSRLKYLAEKLEQCDREKAFLARIPCETAGGEFVGRDSSLQIAGR